MRSTTLPAARRLACDAALAAACIPWLLAVAACSSTPAPGRQSPKTSFVTNITAEGVKQFTFSVERQAEGGGGRGRMGGRGGMRGGRGLGGGMRGGGQDRIDRASIQERIHGRVRDLLETRLQETSYCREGHEVLDGSFERGLARIVGQCVDAATADDRTRFPNTAGD